MERTSIFFNEIRIIQNLNEGEKSGTQLHADLKPLTYKYPVFDVLLDEFETKEDLKKIFHDIKEGIKTRSRFPIIHFEVHGDKKGLGLTSNVFIPWEEILNELMEINILTRNSLVISMGVCFGAYFGLSAFEKGVGERSAFVLLIAPAKEVGDKNIYEVFYNFYVGLVTDKNFNQAFSEIKIDKDLYFLQSAEIRINQLIQGMRDIVESPDFIIECRSALDQLIKSGSDPLPGKTYQKKLKHVKKHRRIFYKEELKKMRDKYLMIDIFPDNAERFASFEVIWDEYL